MLSIKRNYQKSKSLKLIYISGQTRDHLLSADVKVGFYSLKNPSLKTMLANIYFEF